MTVSPGGAAPTAGAPLPEVNPPVRGAWRRLEINKRIKDKSLKDSLTDTARHLDRWILRPLPLGMNVQINQSNGGTWPARWLGV